MLNRTVNVSIPSGVTVSRLPYWHQVTPLIPKKGNENEAQRWLVMVSFPIIGKRNDKKFKQWTTVAIILNPICWPLSANQFQSTQHLGGYLLFNRMYRLLASGLTPALAALGPDADHLIYLIDCSNLQLS